MKILHVNDHLSESGGVETYLLRTCPELSKRGHEVHVAYGTGDDLLPNSHRIPTISSIRRADDLTCANQIQRLCSAVDPDVVHMHGVNNAGAIRALAATGRCVLHTHDYRAICPASTYFFRRTENVCSRVCGLGCFSQTALKKCMTLRPGAAPYFYQRARWNIRHSRRFIQVLCPSHYTADRYIKSGFAPSRVRVIPSFSPLTPTAQPRPIPATPTITFIGRARPIKGWRYFVEALGLLSSSVQGVMVGDFGGSVRTEIAQLADQHRCSQRLRLEPWAPRDHVHRVYERSTVVLFPSISPETLGLVGLEAMALGVPVVASDIGGVREWLHDGVTGRLAAPKSAADLAAGARELLEPENNRRYGQNGQQLIREKFLPDQHITKLLAAYEAARQARS